MHIQSFRRVFLTIRTNEICKNTGRRGGLNPHLAIFDVVIFSRTHNVDITRFVAELVVPFASGTRVTTTYITLATCHQQPPSAEAYRAVGHSDFRRNLKSDYTAIFARAPQR